MDGQGRFQINDPEKESVSGMWVGGKKIRGRGLMQREAYRKAQRKERAGVCWGLGGAAQKETRLEKQVGPASASHYEHWTWSSPPARQQSSWRLRVELELKSRAASSLQRYRLPANLLKLILVNILAHQDHLSPGLGAAAICPFSILPKQSFTFTFHFPALEKEMATHSSVLAWRISGMGAPGGLPSVGLHRVGHDWSNVAAAGAATWLVTG